MMGPSHQSFNLYSEGNTFPTMTLQHSVY